MLTNIEIQNFGPIKSVDWANVGRINLIIGKNDSGKTFLLKLLYSSLRSLEEYQRGNDQRSIAEILAQKLYWTFQPEKIGDLVRKGAESALHSRLSIAGNWFEYRFGKDTVKNINIIANDIPPRASNSIFLPAKEVLSLHAIILKSREQDNVFGFDDTYLDLARALRYPPTRGRNYPEFAQARAILAEMLAGRVEYDEVSGNWQFRRSGNQKFSIGTTAEAIKKIAILDTLLGNRYLDLNSVIFIDEPESALHPATISKFLEIIVMLGIRGMQVFMASHSYFVIKKLYVLAQEKSLSIPIVLTDDQQWQILDLQNGMPDNPIIDESIQLYKQEIKLAMP